MQDRLWPRWIFLRALAVIFFSAFYSLAYQIHGLIGEKGILPADFYLSSIATQLGPVTRVWYAPTLLWIGASDAALTVLIVCGITASVLLFINVYPKLSVALCTLFFLSCIAALQDFSSYQSDGMLLEAGFISMFFAPRGARPGLGVDQPPTRLSLFMLQWEWFRIYFESGLVKLMSGDPHWRNFTAMDEYYQNGPLPSWMGWYVQQMPHWYHAGTVAFTLVVELFLVWMLFMGRRARLACFVVVTGLQIGIIATANYAFLNYLVLVLGVLLLDDGMLARVGFAQPAAPDATRERHPVARRAEVVILGVAFYTTIVAFLFGGSASFLSLPDRLLSPFRIANAYGLFAVMTEQRYEIEFQGSNDGKTWIPYEFKYKPQNPAERPGFYAPYQPRFDWNLWFASLTSWRSAPWVVLAEQRLVEGSPQVLSLFRGDPFKGKPPTMVRTILWQYWFTDLATKRKTKDWWRRQELAPYAPPVMRDSTGKMIFGGEL
jgi:hypothetical protein